MPKTIALIGTGFVGGLYATELERVVRALKCSVDWVLYDPDTVEDRNTANQIFMPRDVGKAKVQALARHLKELGCAVPPQRNAKPAGLMTLKTLDPQQTLVVCAIDKVADREQLWLAAKVHEVPTLWLGLSDTGDGSADWTRLPEWDNAPFKSDVVALGKAAAIEERPTLPPCELIRYRSAGVNLALAGVKASLLYLFGEDLDKVSGAAEQPASQWLSEWSSSPTGHGVRSVLNLAEVSHG